MDSTFVPSTHFIAEVEQSWLAFFMGGSFQNSHRCDLPTRETRLYFAPFDETELVGECWAHEVDLTGFDVGQGQRRGWERFTYPKRIGHRIDSLSGFVWRAEHSGSRCELRAKRIAADRWKVEYLSEVVDRELRGVLEAYFRMIDPTTFMIVKVRLLKELAMVAAAASQIMSPYRAFHPEPFRALEKVAKEVGVDVSEGHSKCWEEMFPRRMSLPRWWEMLLALPLGEEQPTSHEGFNVLNAWQIKHADIIFERYRLQMVRQIAHGHNLVPPQQLLSELVEMAKVLHRHLKAPPNFSFRPYLWGLSEVEQNKVLSQASEQLGWEVS